MSDLNSQPGEEAVPMGKKAEMLRAAPVLFEPGQLVEIRLKRRDGHIASRCYKDHAKVAAVLAKEDAGERWAAAWWTPQQLKPNAHAGKRNGETAKRADIEAAGMDRELVRRHDLDEPNLPCEEHEDEALDENRDCSLCPKEGEQE